MIPNDPLYKDQWHLHVLEMDKVWDVEIGDPGVLVAVVEAGFDVEHPDLVNRIHAHHPRGRRPPARHGGAVGGGRYKAAAVRRATRGRRLQPSGEC